MASNCIDRERFMEIEGNLRNLIWLKGKGAQIGLWDDDNDDFYILDARDLRELLETWKEMYIRKQMEGLIFNAAEAE